MTRFTGKLALVLLGALSSVALALAPLQGRATPAPAPVSAVQTRPQSAAPPGLPLPGHFAGKFELVPLTDHKACPKGFAAGQQCPVIVNGHQYLSLRNTIMFRRPNGELLTMPAGMTTDLASVPQIFWPLLPPDGPYGEASVPHDLCFKSMGGFVWFHQVWRSRPTPYTRPECNEILREGMVSLGVPAWKRIVVFEGVEAGNVLAPGAWGR